MAVLQEDLDSHELWTVCETVCDLINNALENVDQGEFRTLIRLSESVAAAAELRNVPAWRFPDASSISGLQAQFEEAAVPLRGLIDDPDASIRDQIEVILVQIAVHLMNTPTPVVSSQTVADLSQLTERYKDGIAKAIDSARSSMEAAEDELQKVVAAKDEAITALTQQLDDLKATIATEKSDVSAQAARLDTALTTNNTAFTSRMTDWQGTLDATVQEAKTALAEQLLNSEKEAKVHVGNLEELEKQSRNVVEATARNSISTEYGTHARRENRAATIWSICAVILAVLVLGALLMMVNDIKEVTVPETIWKTSVSALTLAIATCMGREASGHRKEARDAKRTQLDLNALEPFLANMHETTAQDLRERCGCWR